MHTIILGTRIFHDLCQKYNGGEYLRHVPEVARKGDGTVSRTAQAIADNNAIGHYQAAVDTGRSVGDVLTTTWALVGLGEATAELGDHATAARYAEQAGAMIGALSELGPTDELASRIDALRSRVAPLTADVK